MRKVFIVIFRIGLIFGLSVTAIAGNGNSGNGQPFQNLQNQIDDNYTDIIDHENRIQAIENGIGSGNIIGRVFPGAVSNLQPGVIEQFIYNCDPGETIVSTDYIVDKKLNVTRVGHDTISNFFVLQVTPIGNAPVSGVVFGNLFCREP